MNSKGGTGKSSGFIAFVNYLRSIGLKPAVYDGDIRNFSAFKQLGKKENGVFLDEQDPLTGCLAYNLRAEKDTDSYVGRSLFINSLGNEHDIVVHDLPGGSEESLSQIFDSGESLDLLKETIAELGYEIHLLHVINTSEEAQASVDNAIEVWGDGVKHHAILNFIEATRHEEFQYWNGFTASNGKERGGKARAKLLSLGGVEVKLPKFNIVARDLMAGEKVQFTDYESYPFNALEKQHIKNFLKQSGIEMEKLWNVINKD